MDKDRQGARRALEDRYEVRLAGEGGQGMILAGVILAEAAAVYDGLNAVQTQSYGPEARGGASTKEVIIARGEVDYPNVMDADLLLCMSQEACDRFYEQVTENGLIVVDSTSVSRLPSHRAVAVPISELAEQAVGRRIAASIVALGVISSLTGVVSRDALAKAVAGRVPAGTEEMNLKAMDAGYDAAQRLKLELRDLPGAWVPPQPFAPAGEPGGEAQR
jgi:2-oxoglutarate ferredoxin oxidoreductase subunit gamma